MGGFYKWEIDMEEKREREYEERQKDQTNFACGVVMAESETAGNLKYMRNIILNSKMKEKRERRENEREMKE
jgi:hypothetical protein